MAGKSKHMQGFTLIESLVALALVSVMAIVGYTLYSFINNSVSIGDRQANLQFYSRLAQTTIQNKVKYASSIKILPAVPATDDIAETQKAIYVNDSGIIIEKSSDGTETPLLTNFSEDVAMSLSFRKISEEDIDIGNRLLGFTISSESCGDTYQLNSSILNLSSANLDDGAETGVAIVYKPNKPDD